MADIDWQNAVNVIEPYVVKILTPRGFGTGFFFAHASNNNLCAIATAAHVIQDSYDWEEPIKFFHLKSGKSVLFHPAERAVFMDLKLDSAVILIEKDKIEFPSIPLELAPEKKFLQVGNEVGWVGFPAIAPTDLCFLSGRVSCFQEKDESYLVDGVAIHGVSGGPAFHIYKEKIVLMGIVSAYRPNRSTGESLPGFCILRRVSQLQESVKKFKNMDEAKGGEAEKKGEALPQIEPGLSNPPKEPN
jgi:hypothetical protein